MTKIKPLGKRILIELQKAPTTKGGLFLPTSGKEKPTQGKVVAFGDVKDINIGDLVYFTEYTGSPIPGEDNLLILDEEDVLAILS